MDTSALRALREDGLAALLERRPEALAAPVPGSLAELAERLDEPYAVVSAMRRLDTPTLQVAEVLAALGGEDVPRSAAFALLDGGGGSAAEGALATLAGSGLVTGDRSVSLVEAARLAFGAPLDLGPPLAALLAELRADDLRVIARNLDLRPPSRKAELTVAVAAVLRDQDRVRSIVAAAPQPARRLLHDTAATGKPVEGWNARSTAGGPVRWAYERGLLITIGDWSSVLAMPGEVALAVRGPGWHAQFDRTHPDRCGCRFRRRWPIGRRPRRRVSCCAPRRRCSKRRVAFRCRCCVAAASAYGSCGGWRRASAAWCPT